MSARRLLPAVIVTAAGLALLFVALLTARLWQAEGDRATAQAQEQHAREADLALWRIENRAAALVGEQSLWPLDDPAPPHHSPWVVAARRLAVEAAAGDPDAADAWLAERLPAPQPTPALALTPITQAEASYNSRILNNLDQQAIQTAAANTYDNALRPAPDATVYSRMLPRVKGDQLTLLRRVQRGPRRFIQQITLDPARVATELAGALGPDLPHASLRLLVNDSDAPPQLRVAALPFYLDPGPLPASITSRGGLARVLVLGWTIVLTAVALAVLAALALLRLDRRRAAFVAAVTHEMRTPLTTFRLYTDLLADGAVTDPADQQTYFRTLRAQSVRLASLVNNVLTFARLERRQRIALETTPVAALMERCLPHLQDRAALDEMSVAWTPGDAADHPVQAAPALVEQILFNLVDNAGKYGQNEAHPTLDLTARADATHVHLTLRDHGPGLHESVGDLFKPFVRTPQREADASPGVGLGLALSRRMARAMGGELGVASLDTGEVGAGFVLSLLRTDPA